MELIEEMMLATNKFVAEFFVKNEVPYLSRVHDPPDEKKMIDFNEFVHPFGIRVYHPIKSSDL